MKGACPPKSAALYLNKRRDETAPMPKIKDAVQAAQVPGYETHRVPSRRCTTGAKRTATELPFHPTKMGGVRDNSISAD